MERELPGSTQPDSLESDFDDCSDDECPDCGGTGYNPETRQLANSFYDFGIPDSGWYDKITSDEVQALLVFHRLLELTHTLTQKAGWQRRADCHIPTAEEVNAWAREATIGHDTINCGILVKTRAQRLGVWGFCPRCHGKGGI